MSNLATVNMGYRQRYSQMSKLLYMTDGYHQPKMYDGASLVNWGISAPSTAMSLSATSTGSNVLDSCETAWTPASSSVYDGESLMSIVSGVTNCICSLSSDRKVGSFSNLFLMGYNAEPITSATMLMLHMNGTQGSTTITDSSPSARTITHTLNVNSFLDTASAKWGSAGLLSAKSGATCYNHLHVPASTDWEPDIYTDAFTFEGQFYITEHNATAGYSTLVARNMAGGVSTGSWMLYLPATGTSIKWAIGNTDVLSRSYVFNTSTWYHIRLCVQAGYAYVFINGVLQGAAQAISPGYPLAANSGSLTIGGTGQGGLADGFIGRIDEVRWEKGVALSTSTFVAPIEEYGVWVPVGTSLTGVTGKVLYKNITPADYTGYYGVQFWIKSLLSVAAGDITLHICDSSGGLDVLESVAVPAMLASEWTKVTHKFVSPTLLTSVSSIALSVNRDIGQNGIYIDDVKAVRCLCSVETDPAYISQGGGSVRLDISGNVPSGTLLAYRDFGAVDMRSDTVVLAMIRSSVDLGTQQFKYLLDNTAACASPLESVYFPDLLVKDVYNDAQFTIATPASLAAVVSHGIYLNNSSAVPCTLWIDNVRRATSVVGNLSGRYFTWCSFYNSKYDIESDLSPISGVVDCQTQGISITSIPVSADTQVDMRRIYRSAAGGTVPYLDTIIANNTATTVTLSKSDASILTADRHPSLGEGSGVFQPPPSAPYVVQNKNRFLMAGSYDYSRGTVTVANASATATFTSAQLDDSFIGRTIQIIGDSTSYVITAVNAGAKTATIRPVFDLVSGTYSGTGGAGKSYYIFSDSKNTVFTSYIDDNDTPRPHGFPIQYAQDIIEGQANDVITGIGLVGDGTVVTKFSSTHILEGAYPPFAVSKLSSVTGCISHDTICQDGVAGALWLAGEMGIAYCDGSSVNIISEKIKDIFEGGHTLSLNKALFPLAHAVYDVAAKMYYLFCASSTSSVNDVCIVLDKSEADDIKWYYFTNIKASASTIMYSSTGVGTIYITDYDGFQYQLNTGWYDGIASGTLSGTATSVVGSVLNDVLATFYTTGSGLRSIPLLVYKVSTGETWVYNIASNTGTSITITGAFTESPSTSDYKYYVGGYQFDWSSKKFELLRPTDKKLLMDAVVNNYKLTASQKVRIQLLKNLASTQIANQLMDLSEGEEQVLLVRERVSQAQWQISGFVHGQNIQIVSLGLRLKSRGIR